MMRILLFGLLNLLLLLPSYGQEAPKVYTIDDIPNVYEQDSTRFVSDPEGYFTPEERAAIDRSFDDLNAHNGIQAVLVVVPAVPEDDELAFTTGLFRKWGIGNARDDSGLLILFVTHPDYRTIRFEVGYGLEGVLTDYRSDRFIREYLVPAVLEGRAAEGFTSMLADMDTLFQEEFDPSNPGAVSREGEGIEFWNLIKWWAIISLGFGVIVILYYSVRQRQRGEHSIELIKEVLTYKSGYTFTPLFMVATVLMPSLFLLLPYFSYLEKKNRSRIADCPKCGTKESVHQIHYPANAPYLTDRDKTESRIGSKTYTILKCGHCDFEEKVSALNPGNKYYDCPECGARAYYVADTVRISSLYVMEHWECAHCGRNISKKRKQSSSSPLVTGGAVGGYIGGGGFRGGSFGGGGFGGGSFGGGMSGGGGASVSF